MPPIAVDDYLYRMLKPTEIKAGMGNRHDFEMWGTARNQVRAPGNAVTPPVPRDHPVAAVLGGLFNYTPEPTALQFAAWLVYLVIVGVLFVRQVCLRRPRRGSAAPSAAPTTASV